MIGKWLCKKFGHKKFWRHRKCYVTPEDHYHAVDILETKQMICKRCGATFSVKEEEYREGFTGFTMPSSMHSDLRKNGEAYLSSWWGNKVIEDNQL